MIERVEDRAMYSIWSTGTDTLIRVSSEQEWQGHYLRSGFMMAESGTRLRLTCNVYIKVW